MEEYGRAGEAADGNKIRRMGIASWITKATNTHSEHETLIAFPREQYLRELSSILRYTSVVSFIIETGCVTGSYELSI